MKRIVSSVLTIIILLSFAACKGNYEVTELEDSIAIPDNGIIEKTVFDKLKNENSVITFTGGSGEFEYEWIVFGSDLDKTRSINLSVSIEKEDKGIKVKFAEKEDFGFPALLSVHLNEKWNTNSAAAYNGDETVYSVSITGSKTSILNISVNKIISEINIIPSEASSSASPVTESETAYETGIADHANNPQDNYLSEIDNSDNRVYSDGNATNQDEYKTDPVPEGKPLPTEPEEQVINEETEYTCTFSIECSAILNNLGDLDPDKLELVPSNGIILPPTEVSFYEGESVFDVLQRVCKENGIHLEFSWTPVYNSAYIEGINNIYEFDCGELSGWMYRVDGWYPNYGCSRYQLVNGETVEWRYTCDLGKDVGCEWMA